MANKHKPMQRGSAKRPEKSQRNVNIIKHFQPNVRFNRYHMNCDFPEIDADVDTKENSSRLKKKRLSIRTANSSNKPLRLANLKNEENRIVKKIGNNNCATKSVLSKNKLCITSGSSSSREVDSAILKNITSVNSLQIPNIRSSMSTSCSPSRANGNFKQKHYQSKKAKTCSVINKKKSNNSMDSLKSEYENKISSISSLNLSRNLILDLKKEITDNQSRHPGHPHLKVNNAINPRSGTVEYLRDEIKNLINNNLYDKRKHLAEIKAEISNFRNLSGDVLVYNVNIENNKCKSDSQRNVRNITPNENYMNSSQESSSEKEVIKDHQQMRCSKTLQLCPKNIKGKSKSQNSSKARAIGQQEDEGFLFQKVTEKFAECLNYPGTDESIRSKIDQTNTLIQKLQQTLNEIRCKSRPSTQGVTTTDTEIEKSFSSNDTNRSTSEPDREITRDQPEENLRTRKDVEAISDKESIISSPKSPVILYNELVTSPREESNISRGVINTLNRHEDIERELPRPKTRRNSTPDEMCDIDRFQNTPKIDEEAEYLSDTGFQVLQAKLNTINEQTESDVSSLSEAKPTPEEYEVSCSFKDFKSGGTPTNSVSIQCEDSLNLTIETPQKYEIPPKQLNKTTQLMVQLLPPVNITKGPAPQKLLCLSIDPLGKTHLHYRSHCQNVGYFEFHSPSFTALIPIAQYKQSTVRFHKVLSIPLDASSHEDKSEEADEEERDSGKDSMVLNEFINPIEEIAGSEISPESTGIQANHVAQKELQSELNSSSDQADVSPQLKVLYGEDPQVPLIDEMRNAESNITVERFNFPMKRTDKDTLCDAKESSSFNLIDLKHQHTNLSSRKSVSDPNIYESINEVRPKRTEFKKNPELDKDLIYKSFQLFKNIIDHDPGSLSVNSTDLISTMDESVYRTYINPSGFHRHNPQGTSANKITKKMSTLEKLSSLKSFIPESQTKNLDEEPEKDIQIRSQSAPATQPSKNTSKLYNIGLYSTKSTQFSPPPGRVTQELKKESKEYLPVLRERSSQTSIAHIEPVASDNVSYEKISLTISYSTDESSNETSLRASGTKENSSNPKTHSITEEEHQIRVVEPEVEPVNSTIEKQGINRERKSKTSHGEIPQDVKKFKELRRKITEEHNIVPSKSLINSSMNNSIDSADDISASIPTFITGLITRNPEDLQKVIPQMRRTVHGAKKRLSVSKPLFDKMENENATDTDEEEESGNARYTVLPVRVQELPNPPVVPLKEDHVSVSPLQTGKSGRYEDEENMFCENNYPKIEETLERRFQYNPGNVHHRIEHRVDSSNSDTITSEKTFSEGEIKCRCCVSIGEMHRCESKPVSTHRRPSPFHREEKMRIRKKKSYFNNWVTYYINKNASLVNDSSSTS